MGKISKPFTWTVGATIVDTELNSVFDTIYAEFNGNIDNSNIKDGANIDGAKLLNTSITSNKIANNTLQDSLMDYTSVKVLRIGPNIAGNGLRVAKGTKAFTYSTGAATVIISFATDCDDGNPTFASAPKVIAQVIHSGGANQHTVKKLDSKASGFSLEVRSSSGADASSGSIDWIAIGQI